MKVGSSTILLFLLGLVAVPQLTFGSGDHSHDVEEMCSEFNVTDAATCATWCGNKTAEFTYIQEHGDFEDLHIDYLKAWECHCESADEDEQHCLIPYSLPTCQSKGLLDCGANATMTCGELCMEVGLGNENSTTVTSAERRMDHITDTHFCSYHVHDHDRRLSEEDEEAVTICFCNAEEEAAKDHTVACSDAEFEEHEDSGAAGTIVSIATITTMALICVGF